MPWDTGLLPEQRKAACHIGSHACLRAGPGTGKTLTLARRVVYLIVEENVSPDEILALTFTRAAAHELRSRISEELKPYKKHLPRISTLHSFALRQLLRNHDIITTLPSPLRIADDWEERNIILEDLKGILGIDRIREARRKLNLLSSDWQTLKADEEHWEERYPEPEFIRAWRPHSRTYGYTLRSQLVYELKRALERNHDFRLEQHFKHVLVDEYQDLNRCDLAVIQALARRDAQLFAAGDDDQSIYGFRFAHPEGIRRFDKDYQPCSLLDLKYCKRCDKRILDIGLFVAELDTQRIKKPIEPMADANEGEVQLLRFNDQHEEADTVAKICKRFIDKKGYRPEDILILLRSDHLGLFSKVLKENLEAQSVPVARKTDYVAPLDSDEGRELLSILRICNTHDDHLAWRTLLQIRKNRLVGKTVLSSIYDLAQKEGITFAAALKRVKDSPDCIPKLGHRVCTEVKAIEDIISRFDAKVGKGENLTDKVQELVEHIITNAEMRAEILDYLQGVVETSEAETLTDLLSALSVSMEDKEQDIDHEKINILTMHKAKGLTRDIVFVVGAEDEYIPGKQAGEEEGDALRLLYVSLTRARHILVVTYCAKRSGQQRWTGRNSGSLKRTLSRFLSDASLRPQRGTDYLNSLKA